MKPNDPTDPRSWLLRAKGNLNLAEKGGRLKGVLLEDLCLTLNRLLKKHSKQYALLKVWIYPKHIHLFI